MLTNEKSASLIVRVCLIPQETASIMGYDLYFINETKKELLFSKATDTTGLDFAPHLAWYLSRCKGDTLRIVGKEDATVERELLSESSVYTHVWLENYYPQ